MTRQRAFVVKLNMPDDVSEEGVMAHMQRTLQQFYGFSVQVSIGYQTRYRRKEKAQP